MELAREHVRKRPGMYCGDLHDGSGVLNLLLEIVGDAFDQYLAAWPEAAAIVRAGGEAASGTRR